MQREIPDEGRRPALEFLQVVGAVIFCDFLGFLTATINPHAGAAVALVGAALASWAIVGPNSPGRLSKTIAATALNAFVLFVGLAALFLYALGRYGLG